MPSTSDPEAASDGLQELLELLRVELGDGRWSDCKVRMLNSGFLTVTNYSQHDQSWNRSNNSPAFFIQCAHNSTSDYDVLAALLTKSTFQALGVLIEKDHFSAGSLMVAFILCAVCVGSWMLLLVLLLLPANNHNHRKKMVYLGVVYQAVWHTVILTRAVDTVFKKQYAANYQNALEYYQVMVTSTLFTVMLFFATLISNLNWLDIVYYMFHNYREYRSSWVPRLLNSKNKQIMAVGLFLTCAQAVLMGASLWHADHYFSVAGILLRTVEFVIYTLFTICIVYYVWHDFGFTLVPKQHQTQRSWLSMFLLMWKDYHEPILLLAYNAAVMALLYVCTVLLITIPHHVGNWMDTLISFLNVLVTVNTWGLIGVLERRERNLSKETVLGRKINNKDRFFVDPNVNYDADDCFAMGEEAPVSEDAASSRSRAAHSVGLGLVTRPAKALKSKITGKRQNDFSEIKAHNRAGSKSKSNRRRSLERREVEGQDWNLSDQGDNDSTETLLTRNYIFNHDSEP